MTDVAEADRKLRETVSECKSKRRNEMANTLPDVTSVRSNHNLISVYCEGKIADEVLEHQAFIIPDGTSRQGVGDIAGAVFKVELLKVCKLVNVIGETGLRPYTIFLTVLRQHQTRM